MFGILRLFGLILDIFVFPTHDTSGKKTDFWAPGVGKETGFLARRLTDYLAPKHMNVLPKQIRSYIRVVKQRCMELNEEGRVQYLSRNSLARVHKDTLIHTRML